jgi:hypothetical protein
MNGLNTQRAYMMIPTPVRPPVLLEAEPDQVGAADLGERGGDEQGDRARGHVAIVAAGVAVIM